MAVKKTTPKNKGGRPKIKIDQRQFEKLCALDCTEAEICGVLNNGEGIDHKTLDRWCKETYKDENGKPMGFSQIFKIKRSIGNASLRRNMHKMSETNAAVAIFLAKNRLGMQDKLDIKSDVTQTVIIDDVKE